MKKTIKTMLILSIISICNFASITLNFTNADFSNQEILMPIDDNDLYVGKES